MKLASHTFGSMSIVHFLFRLISVLFLKGKCIWTENSDNKNRFGRIFGKVENIMYTLQSTLYVQYLFMANTKYNTY